MQCMAPIYFAQAPTRCANKIVSKFHCAEHKDKATKLYKIYKKLCDLAETCDLNDYTNKPTLSEKIKFLNRCFLVFKRAYDARMDHRKYSFVPYFWDDGHNLQFVKLKKKWERCELLISQLVLLSEPLRGLPYDSEPTVFEPETNQDRENKIPKEEWLQLVCESQKKVRAFQIQRQEDEKQFQEELKSYKQEFVTEQNQCTTLVKHLKKLLSPFIPRSDIEYAILLQAFLKWQTWKIATLDYILNTIVLPSEKRRTLTSLHSTELQLYINQLIDVDTKSSFLRMTKGWEFDSKQCPSLCLDDNDNMLYLQNIHPNQKPSTRELSQKVELTKLCGKFANAPHLIAPMLKQMDLKKIECLADGCDISDLRNMHQFAKHLTKRVKKRV